MPEVVVIRREFVQPNPFFWKLLGAHRKLPADEVQNLFAHRRFVALDPGETTGVAKWHGPKQEIELLQLDTKNLWTGIQAIKAELQLPFTPDHLRYEEYRIYNWMADQHSWSILHTPQLIGAIRYLCHQEGIPHDCKLAQHAKAMWTDDNLKRCELYQPGIHHARDAQRHLLFYMANPNAKD